MQNNKNPFSMEDAVRLAGTPAGQQLLALLQSTGGSSMEDARKAVEKGDYTQAKNSLSEILKSPQVQKLLREMEQGHE